MVSPVCMIIVVQRQETVSRDIPVFTAMTYMILTAVINKLNPKEQQHGKA
jgi:hypothetical protein